MTGSFSLETIKEKVNILDLLESYIKVQKKGNLGWAKCPFHKERTASFCINGVKSFFHCFGCGAHGDIFSFVQKYSQVSFQDAVKEICTKYNIPLPTFFPRNSDKELKNTNEKLARLFHECLNDYLSLTEAEKYENKIIDHAQVKQFLGKRNVPESIVEKFFLGFFSNDFQSIIKQENFDPNQLNNIGVLNVNNNFPFLNRLIFPIYNLQSEVIGFTARALIQGQLPKYIHTKETVLFSKSCCLYNIQNTLANQRVFVVEGVFDVISLHIHQYTNAVASLGTSIAYEQMLVLSRRFSEVICIFDGDEAGYKGLVNFAKIGLQLSNIKTDFFIIEMPKNEDPDSLLRKSPEILEQLIESKKHIIDFLWESILSELNQEISPETFLQIKLKINEYENLVTNPEYKQIVKEIWNRRLSIIRRSLVNQFGAQKKPRKISVQSPVEQEWIFLGILIMFPHFIDEFLEQIAMASFKNKSTKDIVDLLLSIKTNKIEMNQVGDGEVFFNESDLQKNHNDDNIDLEINEIGDNEPIEFTKQVIMTVLEKKQGPQVLEKIFCDYVQVLSTEEEVSRHFIEDFLSKTQEKSINIQKSTGINRIFIEMP